MLKFLDVNAHLSPTQAKILLEIRIPALLLLRLVREGLLRLLCRAVAVRLLVPSLLGGITNNLKKGQPGACSSRLRRLRGRVRPLWVYCRQPFPTFLQGSALVVADAGKSWG
ncbi:hypothetical protein VPH35_100351 [Triticum aestivum]